MGAGITSPRTLGTAALAASALAAFVLIAAPAPAGASKLRVHSLSSEPDLVTGGDSLIAIDVPDGVKTGKVAVRRNGVGVSSRFEPSAPGSKRLVGLVGGLRPGANVISARAPGVSRTAALDLYDSSDKGPLISGAQQSPFICTTEAAGLGPATDADCSAPTRVEYRYRSTDGSFKALADPASHPADLAQTTTRDGRTVDYIVRLESGVINRSIYRWAVLAPGGDPAGGWNRRFIYSFGGGCGAGYQQGSNGAGTVLVDRQLSEGYAVISSSLTVLGTACNDVLSAETVAMTKEHVSESLGSAPVWTIGEGGSGGSVQAQMIGQNYPGLLDGLLPTASFPDNSSPDYPDCRLLTNYYASADGSGLGNPQKRAISGLDDPDGCLALSVGADVVNATEGCAENVVPANLIFDPVSNPDGARCTVWDSMVNIYGADPATGWARRSLDNVGVQYGLEALNGGLLTPKEFLDLNQGIGGYDNNGFIVPQRTVADPQALETAYRTGRINQGAGGIPDLPIIDARVYVDDEINVHQYLNTYRFRARLLAGNGTYANQVMFRAAGGPNTGPMNDAALEEMGQWLDAIDADDSSKPASEKVIDDKPASAVDACWTNGGQRTNGPAVIGDDNLCENTYPPHGLPVNRAGKPLASLAAKCRLKPIDLGDYPALTANQKTRLASIFPNGVCDWSQPGAQQQDLDGTWQEFGPQRTVTQRSRRLSLKLKPRHVEQGRKVKLKAKLGPCPEVRWQTIGFERRVRGKWRQFDSEIADGSTCSASAKVTVRKGSAFRAKAGRDGQFRTAVSEQRRP